MGASISARGLPGLVLGDDVGSILQFHRLSAVRRGERELCLVLEGMHGKERHALEVGMVIAGRLEAVERKLGRNVFGGQLIPARTRPAAFEQIERQELHVGANLFAVDGSGGGAGGCGQARVHQALRVVARRANAEARARKAKHAQVRYTISLNGIITPRF